MDQNTDHIGLILKSKRLSLKRSLSNASQATCISVSYLDAIEKLDHNCLPAAAFTKGFVQSYAKYLGYDADHALALYKKAIKYDDISADIHDNILYANGKKTQTASLTPSLGSFPLVKKIYWMASVCGFILVVAMMIKGSFLSDVIDRSASEISGAQPSGQTKTIQSDMKNKAVSKPQIELLPASVTANTEDLDGDVNSDLPDHFSKLIPSVQAVEKNSVKQSVYDLHAKEDAWVQVLDQSEIILFEGLIEKGQSKSFSGDAYFLFAGNAGAFELYYQGQSLGPLGHRGEMKQKITLSSLIRN